jgi:hypothetical protein
MLTLERSLLNRDYSSKCYESLGFSHFYLQSPCNPLIEDYTQIFHMLAKWDIPPLYGLSHIYKCH